MVLLLLLSPPSISREWIAFAYLAFNLVDWQTRNGEKRDFEYHISVNKARLVLTRTLQLALSWNSPTFSYFFIFLTFFFTNEEKTKNPPGALETRDVALQDDHKKERKRRVQHRYTLLNENIILNFKTGRENSIWVVKNIFDKMDYPYIYLFCLS